MAETTLCASFTEALGADPVGTAGEYHAVVVVDLPLPWPREILDHALLHGVAGAVADAAAAGRLVRVLGSVPESSGPLAVRHWSRPVDVPAAGFVGRQHAPTDVTPAVHRAVAGEHEGDLVDERHLLVCTHGTRDRCCGAFGTRVHATLAAGPSPARVLRISHTGGHRYAPTAISLPEGRAWAFLDGTTAALVAARSGPAPTLRRHDRGSLTMPAAAQVVDAALFERHGWSWLDTPRLGRVVETTDQGTLAEVTWTDAGGTIRTVRGEVRVQREIPAVDCGVAVDPHKTYPEWGLATLVDVAGN